MLALVGLRFGRSSLASLLLSVAACFIATPSAPAASGEEPSRAITIIRDVDGDGVRDRAEFWPDSSADPYGPGEVVIFAGTHSRSEREPPPREIARFAVAKELALRALAERHPADLNDDQRIDHLDIQLLGRRLGHTLRLKGGPGDVNRDGVVDAADMTTLLLAIAPRRSAAWIRWSSDWPAGFHPDLDRGLMYEFKRECGWESGVFFCTIQSGPPGPGGLGVPGDGPHPEPPDPPDDCGIMFTPDPLTHLPNAVEAMALPGDIEQILTDVDTDCNAPPSTVFYKVHDTSVALIVDNNDQRVPWIQGPAQGSVEVIGLHEGTTWIEAYADKLDGEFLGSITVKVGGTISVDYWNAPTFTPSVYDPSPPAPSQIPGDTDPPARGPIPAEVFSAAIGLPDDTCDLRIVVRDADGQPKPGKAVRLVPRNNLLTTSGRNVIFFTDQRGRASAIVSADPFLTAGRGSNVPSLRDELAILVGRTALDYDENQPSTLDTLHASQLFTHHLFTGNTLYFGGPIVYDGLEQFATGLSLELCILNKVHLAIIRTHLEGRTYAPGGWIDFEKIQLALWDPATGATELMGYEEPVPLLCTPSELEFPDFVHNFVLNPLSDMWTPPLVKKYAYDFGLAPYDDEDEKTPPGLVTAGAIAAEFGIAFLPGADVIDAIRYGLIENLDEDGAQANNYVIAMVAIAGLAADAGYLAGGAPGVVLNACAASIKVIVKHMGARAVEVIRHLIDDGIVENLRFLIEYIRKIPPPPGFSWLDPSQVTQHVVNLTADTINQWNRVLHSPIGLEEEHLAGALNIIGRRGTRTLSEDATEGATYLIKIGRSAAAEALYDEFSEEVVEAAFKHAASLGHRGFTNLSDDSIRGLATAVRAVGIDSPWVEEIIQGTMLDQGRAILLFGNLPPLAHVDGLDRLIWYFRNNANNASGFDGAIFEGTVARRIQNGEYPQWSALTDVSNDGLPNLTRIDTRTATHGIQIKYKTANEHFVPSDIRGGGLSGLSYLLSMQAQALGNGRTPLLVINRDPSPNLRSMLKANQISWEVVPH